MRLRAGEGCSEFTCAGCGRTMIAIGVEEPPALCGRCTVMPGWADALPRPQAAAPVAGESDLDPGRVLH